MQHEQMLKEQCDILQRLTSQKISLNVIHVDSGINHKCYCDNIHSYQDNPPPSINTQYGKSRLII